MNLKGFATVALLAVRRQVPCGPRAPPRNQLPADVSRAGTACGSRDLITHAGARQARGADCAPNESAIAKPGSNGIKGRGRRVATACLSAGRLRAQSLSTTRRPKPSRPTSTSTATARTVGLFKKFFTSVGLSGTASTGSTLDPDYAKNGKFYTTHMEDPSIEASGVPQNTMFPGTADGRLHNDRADHDAGAGDASGRVDRVDRLEPVEQHIRRHRRARSSACGSTRAAISSPS